MTASASAADLLFCYGQMYINAEMQKYRSIEYQNKRHAQIRTINETIECVKKEK
jgi:hypothetical protein